MYHMQWTILFHFFTSSDLLLYGKICIACFRVTVLDPHIQKDFQIYGVQKLQMQNLSFSSMDVI